MHFTTAAVILTTLASTAYAHMEMSNPIPLRGKENKLSTNPDFSMTTPLDPSGANFPCKGFLSDLGTPAGGPTISYEAGSQQTLTISGGAPHNGGSCQVSLSYDQGASFKVIKSIVGNCANPAGAGDFPFTIPADAAAGDAVLAWTWFNNVGNREMYMNCAVVTITGSGTSKLEDRPDILVANLALNDCKVPEGTDVVFPNPGDDVTNNNTPKAGPPVGAGCGSAPAGAPPAGPPAGPATGAPETPETEDPVAEAPAPSAPATGAPANGNPAEVIVAPGTSITVVSGDTCEALALANDVTVAQIMSNNPAVNAGCTNLVVGQVLNLRKRSRIMRDLA